MLTVKAKYSGGTINFPEPVPIDGEHEVVVVFLKSLDDDEDAGIPNAPLGKRPLSEMRGIWQGKIQLADDFDEPLDEMEEYM